MMLVYAHRGSSGRYPENTLLAFRKALAAGVDGIELDIQVSADGVPVVIHDRDVSRTTDGSGNVDEMPLAVVHSLDAGGGERVPALSDVLRLVGDEVHLDIEIKGLGAEQATLDVLKGFPNARAAVSSFHWDALRELLRLEVSVPLWPLAEHVSGALLGVAAKLGSPAVSLRAENYDAGSAEALRDAGLQVMVWTVNDADEARRMRELGAFALCTDFPDLIMRSLEP